MKENIFIIIEGKKKNKEVCVTSADSSDISADGQQVALIAQIR